MTALAVQEARAVARPLKVLVPLIKEDLKHIDEAGLPFKREAGAKLIEARGQMKHGLFGSWLKKNFALSKSTAYQYINLAEAANQNSRVLEFSSMNEFHRETGSPNYRSVTTKQDWHEGVKENVERARREAERLRQEDLTRQQERDAEKKLAHRLIDIGFKILSKELHPDKGGSRDAMSRLNRVRDRLKQHA